MFGALLYLFAARSPRMEGRKAAIVNGLPRFAIVLLTRVIAGIVHDSVHG